MAYRAPRYSYVHAVRDVGASAISLNPGTADTDFPLDNLIDERAGTLFKFDSTESDPSIEIDLGADFVTGLTRLIVPMPHNIEVVYVYDDDAADFVGLTTLGSKDPVTAGETLDLTFTASTQRYIRIRLWNTSATLHYLPQLILTKVQEFDVGPVLGDALDGKAANVTRLNQPTGISPTIQHGADQRILEYFYENPLTDAGGSTDITDMEALVAAVGMYRPFWVDPASFSTPPETDEPVLWMKFAEMPESRLSVLVPASNDRAKTYSLRLIQSLD